MKNEVFEVVEGEYGLICRILLVQNQFIILHKWFIFNNHHLVQILEAFILFGGQQKLKPHTLFYNFPIQDNLLFSLGFRVFGFQIQPIY